MFGHSMVSTKVPPMQRATKTRTPILWRKTNQSKGENHKINSYMASSSRRTRVSAFNTVPILFVIRTFVVKCFHFRQKLFQLSHNHVTPKKVFKTKVRVNEVTKNISSWNKSSYKNKRVVCLLNSILFSDRVELLPFYPFLNDPRSLREQFLVHQPLSQIRTKSQD